MRISRCTDSRGSGTGTRYRARPPRPFARILVFVGLKATSLALGFVALCVLLLAALLGRGPGPQEAAGQEATAPEAPATAAPPSTPPANVPSYFPELTEALSSASAEARPEGIPGLGVTDVLGNLKHSPAQAEFVCGGPEPGDETGTTLWVCSAPATGQSPTYEVVVLGADPRTILWVQATVRGASDEQAAEFFSYVAGLCFREADVPLNPEAWMGANVASGGQVFAGGAELSVYGTEEERTMQVVATVAP